MSLPMRAALSLAAATNRCCGIRRYRTMMRRQRQEVALIQANCRAATAMANLNGECLEAAGRHQRPVRFTAVYVNSSSELRW